MAIYRGAGGAGDAVNDSSSEASAAVIAQAAAEAAAIAAEAAKVAAQLAETNAETAETNAETAETNAETAASNALTSANNASNSAVSAASSASAASSSASSASTSATNAANSSTTAAGSASAAAISATSASNSASSASGYATTASNAATSASASAASATASEAAALASKNAAATSATNAASSASTANSAATTATTQAGIATTQATNASNSASAASTSATNAASSASAASTSASNAATSATNAATSATASANSATASAAARDAALAALDSFDDRYLGTKSADPALDNDGNALVAGALYFNTVSNSMKVYDGSLWLAAYASLSGALLSANNLSDLNNAATSRTNLGVTATGSDTTYAYRANNLSDLANAATARTNLGLGTAATTAATDYATAAQGAKADTALQPAAIGVTVQGYDADLAAFALKTAPTGAVVGTSDTQTLTNKTVNLLSNTLTGTTAQFNTALSDGDFATLAGTETLTNKTISGASNTLSNIGNSSLTNSSITIGGSAVSLGGTVGTLGVAYGGTGLTSLTAGRIPYGNGTSAFNSSSTFVFDGTNLGIGSTLTGTPPKLIVEGASTTDFKALTLRNADVTTGATAVLNFEVTTGVIGDAASSVAQLKGIRTGSGASGALGFWTSNAGVPAERMRIDSSGNVGIGTSSPDAKLRVDLNGGGLVSKFVSNTGSTYITVGAASTYQTQFGYNISSEYGFIQPIAAAGVYDDLVICPSGGNLGLGVTPSAWDTSYKTMQVSYGSVAANTQATILSSNWYYNAGDKYISTFAASQYVQFNGIHKWFNAPSGTAGTAITFTQAMTLDASGSLLVGRTSRLNTEKLSILQGVGFDGVSLTDATNYTSTWSITTAGTTFGSNGALMFGAGAGFAERMRLDSSGNLGIGVTPSAWTAGGNIQLGVSSKRAITTSGTVINLGTNWYYASGTGDTYIGTGAATNYSQDAGVHKWFNAASGTAGNAISFTQAMTLDASGNLGIGTSSPTQRLDISNGGLRAGNVYMYGDDSDLSWGSSGSRPLIRGNITNNTLQFYTASAERMRIDSSGNVGIGTSSPTSFSNSKVLEVAGGTNTGAVLASSNSGTVVAEMQGNNGDGLVYYGSRTNHPVVTRVNGVERMRIGSDGGVMVGTTTSPGAGLISDSKGDVRSIPQNSQTSAYVLVVGDAGKHISITTGGVTCNASIFSAGQAVTIYNNSGSNQTITAGTSVTFRLAGTATTGNRTLAQYGVATLLCVTGGATPTFVVSGAGVS